MVQNVFLRTKPNVIVGTIGQFDNGKTTLTAALSARKAHRFGGKAMTYEGIAKGSVVRDKSKILTILAAHVECETKYRDHEHIDSQGSQVAQGSNDLVFKLRRLPT
jgi:elongation factor Tu